jgi:hypothetical protein
MIPGEISNDAKTTKRNAREPGTPGLDRPQAIVVVEIIWTAMPITVNPMLILSARTTIPPLKIAS